MKRMIPSMSLLAASVAFAWAAPPTTQPSTQPAYPLTTCVIAGEKLGSMGDPIIQTIDGREVRFCCGGCVEEFTKDREASHQKMDAAIIEATKDTYPIDTCLVSGQKLEDGPALVTFVYRPTNQALRFCCKDCVEQFTKDPAPYLSRFAKLTAK